MPEMKVGILFIATGRYVVFWEDFYRSCEKYFLPGHEKTYFLFTDAENLSVGDNVRVVAHRFRGWPEETLMRFDTFLAVESELAETDYLYFINGTMVPRRVVGEEIFPTEEQGLTVTLHPCFYKLPLEAYTYDRQKKSRAYIAPGEGKYYFMGGFNGGRTADFLKLIRDLDAATKADYAKGIIALWHDESHLNKYMLDKNPLILSPAYGFPEGMPFNQENLREFADNYKMLIKDKSNPAYGGHGWLRGLVEHPNEKAPVKKKKKTLKEKLKKCWNKVMRHG